MLRLTNITKAFGAVRAVDDASIEVRGGEIVSIVGENGAGKTTLMRIAAGELPPDTGTIESNGLVELVHQHFMLVSELTVAENLALAHRHPFRLAGRRTIESEAAAATAEAGIDVGDVSRRVAELSVGEKAKLELVKSIARRPATLILDEPTSVLTPTEANEFFAVMRRLAANGTAVILISHKLPEVLAVAERVIVMRGGRVVAETRASETTGEQLAMAMVGSDERIAPHERATPRRGEIALEHRNLIVHHGEIAAIVGVAGNGQTALAAALRDRLERAGHIPEDRTRDGIIARMTIAENLALGGRRWNPSEAVRHAERMIALYGIRARGPLQLAGSLSGGNQQKLVLARALDPRPRVVVAAEPTRGLDVESARFVHRQLRAAADGGSAIVLITSDLDEAFALADAIHVIYRGELSERVSPQEASRVANLMAGMT